MEIQTIINKMRKKKIQKNNRTNRINQEIGKDGKMRLNKQQLNKVDNKKRHSYKI